MTEISAPFTLSTLSRDYREGRTSPVQMANTLLARLDRECPPEVFIWKVEPAAVLARARALEEQFLRDKTILSRLPLFGIPFAVKDNIDVAGASTTCACPDFSYTPKRSASAVDKLLAAGAILIGKTNLDQFATGLVGTRSPYGEVKNPFNPDYVSGGSSSGSAVAVALGLAAFALGTDTAGSGRIPAGFCNLVGIKPTPGLVGTSGVFPACRSLDCLSVFTHTVADGWEVLSVLAGPEENDAYSRPIAALPPVTRRVRIGIPTPLEFLGDTAAESAFKRALEQLKTSDELAEFAEIDFVDVDLAPFAEIAKLLYEGPWVAERRLALGDFFERHGDKIDTTVRAVIGQADGKTAVDTFAALYRLEAGKRHTAAVFEDVDLILTPTAATIHTRAVVAANPIARNSDFGLYTNFVNLLGMCAVALPGPFRSDGLPAGITLLAPGGGDHRLAEFARRVEPLLHRRLGVAAEAATPPRAKNALPPLPSEEPMVRVAVVGAHLSGMPLNWQLVERSAVFVRRTHTAPLYRLYALPGSVPPKPGLVKVKSGTAIEVEIWQMPARHFGSFVAQIPAPLGIGMLTLADDSEIQGFVCDPLATENAEDISSFGGWRAYLSRPTVS